MRYLHLSPSPLRWVIFAGLIECMFGKSLGSRLLNNHINLQIMKTLYCNSTFRLGCSHLYSHLCSHLHLGNLRYANKAEFPQGSTTNQYSIIGIAISYHDASLLRSITKNHCYIFVLCY